jgi:NRPS condensation-like uncharacterized protein
MNKIKKNPIHDGVKNLSGIKHVATSKDFQLRDVKAAAQARGITINDILTSCLATSVKQYFIKLGDSHTEDITIVIPANIRFKHYQSVEKMKMENKFAAVPLRIPIY